MANTLLSYLAQNGVAYDTVQHRPTWTSMNASAAAHIPGNQMAKSVILQDDEGYLMAVIPANRHVKIGKLNHVLDRHMGLATESSLAELFTDCALGAIPPIGEAYGMDTVIDNSLIDCNDVYFESGDHEALIHLKGKAFRQLIKDLPHDNICQH
ncbi:MAG: YbaK/EbsC family protein [Gammaproteobacteria bacterium]